MGCNLHPCFRTMRVFGCFLPTLSSKNLRKRRDHGRIARSSGGPREGKSPTVREFPGGFFASFAKAGGGTWPCSSAPVEQGSSAKPLTRRRPERAARCLFAERIFGPLWMKDTAFWTESGSGLAWASWSTRSPYRTLTSVSEYHWVRGMRLRLDTLAATLVARAAWDDMCAVICCWCSG
jgi:hypothetical protein